MGISDKVHWAWLSEAIDQFESRTGRLAALASKRPSLVLYGLAQGRVDSPTNAIVEKLAPTEVKIVLYDKYHAGANSVQYADVNDLDAMSDNSCDVLTLFRASYFIDNPASFLDHLHRIVRPGGLAFIDWLVGQSSRPMLSLSNAAVYKGIANVFRTTYCDPALVSEFSAEYDALAAHVRRPPWWSGWREEPSLSGRLKRQWRRVWQTIGLQHDVLQVSAANFLEVLDRELTRAGNHLISLEDIAGRFEVVFRHARYQFPQTRKFNLYNLTVWSPIK